MSEWKEYKIEETSIVMVDGDRGKNYPKNKDFSSKGYCLFLNAGNVTKDGFSFSENSFISQKKDLELRKGRLERGDIVITTRGTVGNIALYNTTIPYEHIRINSGMLIIKSGKDILPEYLYYYLKGKYFQEQICQFVSGSAQPQLPKSTLEKMSIFYPKNKDTQQKIAAILSSLDDKIAVNRKINDNFYYQKFLEIVMIWMITSIINDNLEQQAQALFNSWFVDFEPFKNGEFVDTELGRIPKGWKVGTLGEQCKCLLGGTPSRNKAEYWNGDIAWINSGEVNRFRITSPTEYITEQGLKNSATKLLPQKTTVLAITGATLGQVSLLEIDSCANQSVIGVLENNIFPYVFIYPHIKNNINKLMAHMTGGAQQHINKNNVENLSLIIPPATIMNHYKKLTSPIYEKISSSCLEIEYLIQLRDTLLPQLMSGELKINK